MRTFEEALKAAQGRYGEDVNVYEYPNHPRPEWQFAVVYAVHASEYQKLGWKLRATVRYEQKVEIL